MNPRVPMIEPGTDPSLREIEDRILAERGRISPLYRVLLNSGPIASGWERLLSAVRNHSSVPARLRELVILRVAVLNRAAFEFDAHVPHAERAGLTAAQIEALRHTPVPGELAPIERRVLDLTDRMTLDVDVPDALMAELGRDFDACGLVELVTTVAAYNMVSRLLVALRVVH
jgi:4-carboxymuconolactone decarboxylase